MSRLRELISQCLLEHEYRHGRLFPITKEIFSQLSADKAIELLGFVKYDGRIRWRYGVHKNSGKFNKGEMVEYVEYGVIK